MKIFVGALTNFGLLSDDLDYQILRGSMVIIYLFFGYQKWFDYEAQALIPFISHGPLIFWLLAQRNDVDGRPAPAMTLIQTPQNAPAMVERFERRVRQRCE